MAKRTFGNSFVPEDSNVIIVGGHFYSITNNTQIQQAPKSERRLESSRNNLSTEYRQSSGGYERLLEVVAPNASHNSGHDFDAPKCHPGTRIAVIQAIMDWIAGVNDHPRKKDIAWVTGAAGAGKSAMGQNVCERCAQEGTLLASFFFGTNDWTRNHSRSLVATIVYQVCRVIPPVRDAITTIIDNDPLILTRSLREQFATLLIIPLSSSLTPEPGMAPRLIVIDGLDECHSHSSQLEILDALLYVLNVSPIPIRFLVCSRPENWIVNFFSSPHAQERLFKIFLGDEYSPDRDITLYLTDSFKAIKEGHIFKSLIPYAWPSQNHVNELVRNSSGQFIYAATVVRYVESPDHRPNERLESVLGLRAPFKDLPFAHLDTLYLHILRMMDNPQLVIDLLTLPVICTGSMDVQNAARMLALDPEDVEVLLSNSASIVQVGNMPRRNFYLLHKSFSDFIFDPYRSKEFSRNYLATVAKHILSLIKIYSGELIFCNNYAIIMRYLLTLSI